MHLSVIIPTYNEITNLEGLLSRLRESLVKAKFPYELLFIDDHSTDGTFEKLLYHQDDHVRVYAKQGKRGKAFSLIEGFAKARGDVLVMLDADLQYPPEAIPQMVDRLTERDVVVADRNTYHESRIRKVLSIGFRTFFGKLAFQLNHDIQSGLKVFRREVWETVAFQPKSPWTFDLEFLHKAREAGFRVGSYPITFSPRRSGVSKMRFIHQTIEIGANAIAVRFMRIHPQSIAPYENSSMLGAGVGYKGKQYITHTTLPYHISALQTTHLTQKMIITLLALSLLVGFVRSPFLTVQVIVAVLSIIYFLDMVFHIFIVGKSLSSPAEISVSEKELASLLENKLPIYSILCPLYREADVLPQFLDSIAKISWPKDKLDVILLLEEDDIQTRSRVEQIVLPTYVRSIIVPNSSPKTKPKACNFGLGVAKGEYLVVYDAEDIPDPMQLKKAHVAFQKMPSEVVCLQAKLNYYNPHQNLITRLFTAEYSLWFDVMLTGLQSMGTAIPLGGTSNHFRTKDLIFLRGWDPFNVTEDADLGMRLFKIGYKTAIIDSVTLEEANSRSGNWLRQRSRWLKGYMQTYLVHTRKSADFVRQRGIHHALIFHLIVGGKIAFTFINPILWTATISYFLLYQFVGPAIEALYPPVVFYMAVVSLVFGNFLFLYYYMIGLAKKGQWHLIKFVFLVPIYWLMISISAFIALYQLIFKPHYWEKTVHGFHLDKRKGMLIPRLIIETEAAKTGTIFPKQLSEKFSIVFTNKRKYLSGGVLITASVIANILNLFFNVYLGRVLDYGVLGLLGIITSLSYLSTVPFNALSTTVNYRSGYLDGKYGPTLASAFWRYVRKQVLIVSVAVSFVWVVLSPFIASYFQSTSLYPFLLFMLIWLVGFAASVDRGYLFGRIMLGSLAFVSIIEPLVKFGLAALFVAVGMPEYVVSSIPISIVVAFLAGWILVYRSIKKGPVKSDPKAQKFPFTFFGGSVLLGLGTMSFLTLDILLAKHYLSPTQAGQYVLLSLIGKVIFFLGSLSTQFVVTLIGRKEAQGKNSLHTFYYILLATSVLSSLGFLTFALFGNFIAPLLFGKKALAIVSYLPIFGFGVLCFTVSRVFISYYLTKKLYSFPLVSFLFVFLQYYLLAKNHSGIGAFVMVMAIVGGSAFISVVCMHVGVKFVRKVEQAVVDLLSLFAPLPIDTSDATKLRILLFNWRDTKHVWAGGAEAYIHEIAKRWVKSGIEVVLFCGNDYRHAKDEVVEGVRVIRRGGHYTVYVFAFLYYITKLRKKFDIVIDCENGIPFFTPLYARKPVFLLIHHMHQEVFAEHLRFPFSRIAMLLEGKLMPIVYKNNQIITVSESSKKQIVQLKIAKSSDVHIVNPGINNEHFERTEKYPQPTFLYLGRLKSYKNIDVAIQAFALVQHTYPKARLFIVGSGEQSGALKKLVERLHIDSSVYFFGFVTEKTKAELLAKSWAVLHPSMMEGWSISVIEANASGTPVIASNANGLKDSIVNGSTGILVDVGDVEKMARAMVDIIIDKQFRKTLSNQAYIWSSHFDWDTSAESFLSIIKSFKENKSYRYKGEMAVEEISG